MKKIVVFLIVLSAAVTQAQVRSAAEKSAVVLNNGSGLIPIKDLIDLKIASVHFNFDHSAIFDSISNKYWAVTGFDADSIETNAQFYALHDRLKLFNLVLFEFSDKTNFNPALVDFVRDIESKTRLVVVLAGGGKSLAELKIKSPVIWNDSDNESSAAVLAQVIFGGKAVANRLHANYGSIFKKGDGFTTTKTRLAYASPEGVSALSTSIDSIVYAGLALHTAPAVVILVARNGEVIFNKGYGGHTYEGSVATKPDDIFDMASVTKVTATTPAVMRLFDKKLVSLESPISKYIALTRAIPDKKDIKIKEALLHEAGYTPYIKFYEQLKPSDMSTDSSAAYPVAVADHYYLRANYFNDVMWPVTLSSKVETRGKFVYSDVSMYMMKEVVEEVTHQRLNDYVLNEFYLPLGMRSTGFLPRKRFDRSRIVPTTENDNWFRNMLVQGYVNDPGSAMAGGVGGHAGLFSNANDLAIFYQMLLNKGVYGGQRYFSASTVQLFTSRQSKTSGRGYGFARVTEKEATANKNYPSQLAFGHTGYTGTFVWVDPKYNLVYICLTNRVYPDDNKTYGVPRVNIRSLVQDVVYRAVSGR